MSENPSVTRWRTMLGGLPFKKIFAFDLDGTVLEPDTLVGLNEAFGPHAEDGAKRWLEYDRAFKVHGTMTNAEHLQAEYRDLFEVTTLDIMLQWLKNNIRLVAGSKPFLDFLASQEVAAVGISNGVEQIGPVLLNLLDIPMPVACHKLVLDDKQALVNIDWYHDARDGIRKGELISLAEEWGYEIVGCAGDGKGDIDMARATAERGGLILARENTDLARWCQAAAMSQTGGSWVTYDDFRDVLAVVQAQLGL